MAYDPYQIGIGMGVNRAGYDPTTGQYLGQIGTQTGHRPVGDGSYELDNSGYWQSLGLAPGQTHFNNGQYQPGGGFGGYGSTAPRGTSAGNMQGGPQVMPGTSQAQSYNPFTPPPVGSPYTPPPAAPGSATAANPFLNLGLNAFTNTQQPYDSSYLNSVGQSLWNQANQNYKDNLAPAMDSAAITAGGYGGDRAALSKGVVMDRMNQNVFNSIAPLYAQGYENWANRALQGGQASAGVGGNLEQLDLQRLLGMGGLEIQQQNANTNTAAQAATSAGVPSYTNPLAAGVGGAASLAWMLNQIFNQKG